jgi:hypothetical protein
MAEPPTKPGRVTPQVRNALDDTLAAEPSVDPPGGGVVAMPSAPAGRYRLGAELGRGGMGRVVEAFDVQLGRTVALKEVLPRGEPGIARRFAREIELTARLEHPSIVPLYDAGVTADGRPFYVMRRVSGRPLDQLMARAAGLGERLTLLPAVLAAIDAIAHAHRRGVLHRDLKPSNILVGDLGETVVIDWGLAKAISEDDDLPGTAPPIASDSLRTQIGSVFGTPGFMAPEQARGEPLDPRGDVYALGATLYQLLAGAPPHSGTSATEVIARTGSREVTPVGVVAPGAPPELVAIVGKALAFDPAGRYPDAGALGEDVRRFLAGQLVAAHRYTPAQRFARFARRHRGSLGVAALALAAVAVLAWIAVHRIVQERDAADFAWRAAAAGRRVAETARDEAARRADQLVVMHARGVLDSNPTHALAVLKQLPAGSDRLGEARAVAQAAVMRGAAWAIPSSRTLTTIAELSPDARFLLQVSLDGVVQVWDLERRRLVASRRRERGVRALWAGKALLVMPPSARPELFDPFTAAVQPIAVEPIRFAAATAAGDRVAFCDAHGAVGLLDVASRSARPLWPGHAADQVQIAGDGSWIAAGDSQGVAVLDPDGRELTRHPGRATVMYSSRFDALAYLIDLRTIAIATLSPRPAWTEIDLAPYRPAVPIDLAFRGRQLVIALSSGKLLAWNGKRLWEWRTVSTDQRHMREAGSDLLVLGGDDGMLHFFNDELAGDLHLPTPLHGLRLAARPGASRIVAVGEGMIAGFDLADSLPALAPGSPNTQISFVDDDTLLIWPQWSSAWQWYDVRTGTATPLSYDPHGMSLVIDADPDDGRVLVLDHAQVSSLALLRKNTAGVQRLAHGPIVTARLLAHDVVVVASDTRLFAVAGSQPPRELVKLDGRTRGVVRIGATGFAALSENGELVRGDAGTGALARTRVAAGASWGLTGDRAGRVVIALGDRLWLWDPTRLGGGARTAGSAAAEGSARAALGVAGSGAAPGSSAPAGDPGPVEIARLPQDAIWLAPCDSGVLVGLADHAVALSSLVPGAPVTPLLPPASRSAYASRDGNLIIGESVNQRLAVVETATGARWELPGHASPHDLQMLSPTARRFAQSGPRSLALWTLPLAPLDLRRWLDERTNAATDGDDVLTWVWQPASP